MRLVKEIAFGQSPFFIGMGLGCAVGYFGVWGGAGDA
jgi:hypothetical protein